MAWSKVNKDYKHPIGWWYNKVLCEVAWVFRSITEKWYYNHLNKLYRYRFNLYGDKY